VIAATEVVNAFNAQFVPFAVNNYLAVAPTGDKGGLDVELTIILFSNYVSLFAITFLIFCPWKKGPEWYLKFSPKLFYTMMYLNYVILPLINLCIFILNLLNPKFEVRELPLESWVVFF